MKEDRGTISGNIGRSLKNRKIMDVFPNGEYGKHAITHWRVLEKGRTGFNGDTYSYKTSISDWNEWYSVELKKSLFLRCAAPTEWNDSVKNKILGLKKPLIIDFRGVQEEKNNPSRIPKEFLSKEVHLPIEPKVTDLLRGLNEINKSKTTEIDKIFQNAYRK